MIFEQAVSDDGQLSDPVDQSKVGDEILAEFDSRQARICMFASHQREKRHGEGQQLCDAK